MSSPRPRLSHLKKFGLWSFRIACTIMGISMTLGLVDCWVAGTRLRGTLFSLPVWKLRDGGTTCSVGLGYSLTYYRKIGGEHGPEIWYWFTPFTIYRTTERWGVRWLFSSGSEPRQPIYQGRNLSEWISIWFSGYSGHSPHSSNEEMEAAERAIRAMGTNCIPSLIAWVGDGHPSINQRGTALSVFQILGEQARPAGPALVQLTRNKDKEIRYYALDCLLAVKAEKEVFTPALVTLVHDPDKNISYRAAESLLGFDADAAEKAGVFTLFPEFK